MHTYTQQRTFPWDTAVVCVFAMVVLFVTTAEGSDAGPIFAEGFENVSHVFDLFSSGDSRGQQSLTLPAGYDVTISSEQSHTGLHSIKCFARLDDGRQASEVSGGRGLFNFSLETGVWTEAWFFIPDGSPAPALFLVGLEAPDTRNTQPPYLDPGSETECHSFGQRLYLSRQNEPSLKSDLDARCVGEDFGRLLGQDITLPTNEWVRIRTYTRLSHLTDGIMRVWQNDELVLDAVGVTLPRADSVFTWFQVVNTTNGVTSIARTFFVDDFRVWDRPPPWWLNTGQMTIMAAGVPKYLADTASPDYDAIFQELAASGMSAFFPTFQYQELPSSLSLGHESDFLPPCLPGDAAFQAMRSHGIKLIVPGQLLYEPGNYPPIQDDPLVALITCAGRETIQAVFSIDEPARAVTDPLDPQRDVRELFERVKLIDSTLDVMMVHAPIPAFVEEANGSIRPVTQWEIDNYLLDVAGFSQYADMVGFDVYPIPPDVAALTSPYQGGNVVDYATAIPDYLQWLGVTLPGRSRFMALQAFSFDHLWGSAGPPNPPTGARPPTAQELRDMACAARGGGATSIIWWGQGFLTSGDAPLWNNVRMVSTSLANNAAAVCAEPIPAVSAWSILVGALMIVIVGTVALRQKRLGSRSS